MTEALENTFAGIKIGKKDKNGLELFNGDHIEIQITEAVSHKGVIVYEDAAFQLKRFSLGAYRTTPLCSYASYCEITKTK